MLFNSFQYLSFLPLVVLAYWLVPRKLKTAVLVAASYYFYMSWMKAYGLLLLALTAANYLLGLWIASGDNRQRKRLILIGAIAFNLGCLAVFKYSNFFYSCLLQLKAVFPFVDASRHPLPIILPLGISFFVFEFIHYVSDIYKGSRPIYSPLRFALFAAFFPSQIAGPIKRYQDFVKQLDNQPVFSFSQLQEGLWLIVQGLFKKVALGDNLASLVQIGFSAPLNLSTPDAWLCALAFTFQIYFDFSGYTDIGRGSALLMGFSLPDNFNMPYLANSLSDFWHRWHISLSTWLRDYLYIPLGGSRTSDLRAASNLLTTMVLGGLWHGASWHFVIWGAYHGLGLAAERCLKSWLPVKVISSPFVFFSSPAITFLVVVLGWVLFRADNLTQAMQMYQSMWSWNNAPVVLCREFWQSTLPVGLTIYVAVVTLKWALDKLPRLANDFSWAVPTVPARVLAMVFAGLLIVGLSCAKSVPFIYFQF
jgi:alginate O-acetyltransferase complex protein AlgI